ncbi:MAG: lysine exporter LysO family protein [Muribaculaceae bacterium]
MRGSIVIVALFVVGVIAGAMGLAEIPEQSDVSFYVLCALIFFVGMSIGSDTGTLRSFKRLNPRLFALPVLTIAGTIAGSAMAALILPHSATDCMAVGSGLAYYSLSSVLITESRGADLGVVALLANILREIFTLLLAPLLARYVNPLAPIAAGGATTADTTLPIISRASGAGYVPLSIAHGFVCDFSVPFLVSFLCTL